MSEQMLSPGGEKVVWIEYHDDRPCSVVTAHGGACSTWDFEWCERDGCLYYHMSGCGPLWFGCTLGQYSTPVPPPCKLWHLPGAPALGYAAGPENRPVLSPDEILAHGYLVIDEPIVLTGAGERNPFEVAYEGATVWCQHCEDMLPRDEDEPCEHLSWCDECENHVYTVEVGGRAGHMPADSYNIAPVFHAEPKP